jgi:hypothetical protein
VWCGGTPPAAGIVSFGQLKNAQRNKPKKLTQIAATSHHLNQSHRETPVGVAWCDTMFIVWGSVRCGVAAPHQQLASAALAS